MPPAELPAGATVPGATPVPDTPQRPRSARRRAREFAVQGLYQWLLAGAPAEEVRRQLREQDEFERADAGFVDHLVGGAIADSESLSEWMQPFLDRPIKGLSPVERAVLLAAAFELRTAPDSPYGAPYRVVINEAVELAKRFGGTDGHKYVNGVLDKLAATVRADEGAGQPRSRRGTPTAPAPAASALPSDD